MFSKGLENTVGKGKLLVTSNSLFPNSVFKGLVQETHKNEGLLGKELTLHQSTKNWARLNWKHSQTTNSVSPFPTMFSNASSFRIGKSRDYAVKI